MAENLTTNKNYKEITASLLYALESGKGATFIYSGQVIRTSPVEEIFTIHFFSNSEGFAVFDTKNTRYTVIFQNYFKG